ncbi:acyl-CoA dehydrogenase [Sporichthya brevicatena]|uniref:Acyl-CoA dehydrogenase n=1 Tax=Sporichthya brevicatena TaxID=171442 RepID=A0ABN1GYL2_9ACTN
MSVDVFARFPGAVVTDEAEEEFRGRIRDHLATDPAPPFDRNDPDASLPPTLAWHGRLAAAGYALPVSPPEYGGRLRSLGEQLVQVEEMAAVGANSSVNLVGVAMLTPLLLALGTEEQKQTWLPPVARGEHLWCQLFSEPEAGSDLFGMRTTAVPDGDVLVVNGQKIWSSTADHADFGLMLARTEPGSTGRRGIGCFVVDMRSPGVTVRPIRQLGGPAEFAEVFFDDVRVPRGNVVGELGDGALAALRVLASERSGLSMASYAGLAAQFEDLVRLAPPGGGRYRAELLALWEALAVQRLGAIRQASAPPGDEPPLGAAAAGKLAVGTINVQFNELRARLLGPRAFAFPDDDRDVAAISERIVSSLALSLGGGTHQMQRNAIAEGLLGMPRG